MRESVYVPGKKGGQREKKTRKDRAREIGRQAVGGDSEKKFRERDFYCRNMVWPRMEIITYSYI